MTTFLQKASLALLMTASAGCSGLGGLTQEQYSTLITQSGALVELVASTAGQSTALNETQRERVAEFAAKVETLTETSRLAQQALVETQAKLAAVATGAVTPIQGGIGLLTSLAAMWFARNQTRKKDIVKALPDPPAGI